VNDLSKPGASTFESLGELEYKQNGNIHLACERRASTVSIKKHLYSFKNEFLAFKMEVKTILVYCTVLNFRLVKE
jgi:hypothetical protein